MPLGALVNINIMKRPKYFDLEELLRSETALNRGIENLPSWEDVESLQELITDVLDPIRIEWGQPIIVNSGYRSAELNVIVGGVLCSAHMIGRAADVRLAPWSAKSITDLFKLIQAMAADGLIDVDQVILYRKKKIIHISNAYPRRKQFIVK